MSTRFLHLLVAVIMAGAVCVGAVAFAGTTGKLTGRVVDDKNQPLTGANIRIEGQRLGAVTDENGNYVIVGIPAGVHVVRVNMLGYAPFVAANVSIIADFTTTLNAGLKTEAVEIGEVRVEAERPLLQRDATGTTRFISSDDIQKLPTRGYRDAAAQQSGVVNFQRNIDNEAQNQNTLIIRGGRPNETAYYVDGFSQQDPLTGTSSTAISNNAIEEVVLMTGGFAPEYGRIMSGAVNVITREGGSKYFGTVEAITDNLSGGWVGSAPTDYNVYDASLGGPLLPGNDNITFHVSGERRWQRDRSPSHMVQGFEDNLVSLGLDPDFKPTNGASAFAYQGKLAWQLSDQMNVKVGGLGSSEDWNQYLNSYLFNLQHAPRYEDRNQSYFGTFHHALNTKTFYSLGVNYTSTERKRGDGVAFDDLNPQYTYSGADTLSSLDGLIETPGGYFRASNPRFPITMPMFWDEGHVFDDYLQRKSSYMGVQGSWTSQINTYHQLKAGADFQRHTLRFFNHFFPVQLGGDNPNLTDYDAYGYRLDPTYRDLVVRDISGEDTTYTTQRVLTGLRLVENEDSETDGPKHPKSFSLFAQDKFEREGVIINGGLRYDYFNVDTPALVSDQLPLGPDEPGNIPDSLETVDLTDNKTYSRISPRLGVSFPVDEKTILRFNYGQFYQQPNLQDLYVSYRFLQHKVRTGGYFVGFGNPNLKPEHTTAYEVGVQRQMGDNLRMDITAYYKDVKDLVEVTTIPSFPNNFSSYRNRDYATIKGIDVGFLMRPINHISASINYSLLYAYGTGSVSNTQRNVAWQATEPPKQTSPLDFDQRHKISMNLDWRMGNNEGPAWNGWQLLENTGINVLFNVASGTPYTPTFIYDEVTQAAVTGVPSGPLNSRYGPWNSNLDFKLTKGFNLAGLNMEGFAWVLNLFDNENAIVTYTSTGSPTTTGFLNTQDGQAFLATNGDEGERLYRLAENNPNLYANPRLVRFGLRTSF
jgi:outer membrane receptor protein involved in Fe transport